MSRADTLTKLPLADWARYFGMHPLHFEQVRLPNTQNSLCNDIYFQHAWQTSDHVSREDIALAISEAEQKIEAALGYHICPTWEVDEWHLTGRTYRKDLFNLNGADIRGLKSAIQADWGWFISGGIRASSLIEADKTIVWSDEDGDGYTETGTVAIATSVTDVNEIHIYYPGHSGDQAWEIRPTQVSISGGTATITFRRELVVVESKLEPFDIEGAEALYDEDSHFLSEVDVYRVYNDPQTQATLHWEPFANICGCSGAGCVTCSYSSQTGCLILRSNPRLGIVGYSPATWDSDNSEFDSASWAVSRNPEVIRLWYYSGWRDKNATYTNRLDERWGRAVAFYAASLLDRPPCECSANNWGRWRQDLTLIDGDEDGKPTYRNPDGILDNPLGSTRGAVYAWRMITQFQNVPGGAAIGRAVSFA